MKVREVLKMLEQDGWYLDHARQPSPAQTSHKTGLGHGAWQTKR